MATQKDLIRLGIQNGLSEGELTMMVQDYAEEFGGFHREPIPYDSSLALKVAQQNFVDHLSGERRDLLKSLVNIEEIQNYQVKAYYDLKDGRDYSDAELDILKQIEYPTLFPSQILNENNKVASYEPWLTPKADRKATLKEGSQLILNKFWTDTIVRGFAAGAPRLAVDWILPNLNLAGLPLGLPLKFMPNTRKAIDEWGEHSYETVSRFADRNELALIGSVPDYIKSQKSAQIIEAMGELATLAMAAIPYVGAPLMWTNVLGRYYDEALRESDGNEQIAIGYTATFGIIAAYLNKLTLGVGKNFFKNMSPERRKYFTAKSLGIGALQTKGIATGEFLTETAESAYLQQATKGEIDWKQATWEGTLAYIVGLVGGGAFTTINTVKGRNKITEIMKEKGWSESEATGLVNAVSNGDQAQATKILMNKVLEQQGLISVLPNVTENIKIGVYEKYTEGHIRRIRESLTDVEIIEKIDNQIAKGNTKLAIWRDEAIDAMQNPSKESIKKLNDAIHKEALRDKSFTKPRTTKETTEEVTPTKETIESLQQRQDELNEQRRNLEDGQSDEARAIEFEIQKVVNRKKILENEAIINDPNASNSDKSWAYEQLKGLFEQRRKLKKKNVELESKEDLEVDLEYYEAMATLYEGWSSVNPDATIFKQNDPQKLIQNNKRNAQFIREDLAEIKEEETTEEVYKTYDEMTFKELRAFANTKNIKGRSKKDIIAKLIKDDRLAIDEMIEAQREGNIIPNNLPQEEFIDPVGNYLYQRLTLEEDINNIFENENLDTVASLLAVYEMGYEISPSVQKIINKRVIDEVGLDVLNAEIFKRVELLKSIVAKESNSLKNIGVKFSNDMALKPLFERYIKIIYNLSSLKNVDFDIVPARKETIEEIINGIRTETTSYLPQYKTLNEDALFNLKAHLYFLKITLPYITKGDVQGLIYELSKGGYSLEEDLWVKELIDITESINSLIISTSDWDFYGLIPASTKTDEELKKRVLAKEEISTLEEYVHNYFAFFTNEELLSYYELMDQDAKLNANLFDSRYYDKASREEIESNISKVIFEIDRLEKDTKYKIKGRSKEEVFEEYGGFGTVDEYSEELIEGLGLLKDEVVVEETDATPKAVESLKEQFGAQVTDVEIITPKTLGEINKASKILGESYLNNLPILSKLTEQEGDQFVRYILYKMGYNKIQVSYDKEKQKFIEEDLVEIKEEELSLELQNYIREAQVVFNELADQIGDLSEELGIQFEKMPWYFPIKRKDILNKTMAEMEVNNFADFVGSLGFLKTRTGNTYGIEPDPAWQTRQTIGEMAKAITVAKYKKEKLDIYKNNTVDTARAIKKDKLGEEVTQNEKNLLDNYKELQAVEKMAKEEAAVVFKMNESAQSTSQFNDLVDRHQKDGGGLDIPSGNFEIIKNKTLKKWLEKIGQGWANTIDPHFVVQKMDAVELDTIIDEKGRTFNKAKNGYAYGANATLWDQVIWRARLAKQDDVKFRKRQMQVMERYKTKKEIQDINKLLYKIFLTKDTKGDRQWIMSIAKDPQDIQKMYEKQEEEISLKDAITIYWYSQEIQAYQTRVAFGKKNRGILSKAGSEIRKEFFELERRLEENKYENQKEKESDLKKYKSYAPVPSKKVELTEEQKNDSTYILRKTQRFLFEQEAINKKDFFGWFEGTVSQANKGAHFEQQIIQIQAWADYLDSIGQPVNAKWWRGKIHTNIYGDLFKLEDQILEHGLSGLQRFVNVVVGEELTGGFMDRIRSASIDELKQGTIDALTWLQKARINAFLLGNIGWSLTTQPSSLSFVVKQVGFKRTFESLYAEIFGDSDSIVEPIDATGSQVAALKGAGTDIAGIEATDPFREGKVSRGRRAKLRNIMGVFGSKMENLLTRTAYIAGYDHGIKVMGLNEDQARMHGDFVAATTQSMYDRVTRNSVLNSQLLRAMRPMQSYVFTAYSNALDSMNLVGADRAAQVRAREMVRWIITQRLWAAMISIMFGDDLLKALYNPTFNKGTWGSNIPLFGLQVDIAMSKALPWIDDKGWMGDEAGEQFLKATTRIIYAAATNQENWEREALIYVTRYITPAMGIGGSVPMSNTIKLLWVAARENTFEDIKGNPMERMEMNPWNAGMTILHGQKGVISKETEE